MKRKEDKQISAEFPYASKFEEVLGSKMAYIEQGSGDPVLFIHGQPTWSYLWRNIIPYVSKASRAIAVDLIGMGRSGKPDIQYKYEDHIKYLEAFMDALKLKNITFVLHDWGSALGFDYAMRHESNVKGLAFMEAMIAPAFPFESLESLPEGAREVFEGFRDPVRGRELLIEQNMFVEKLIPGFVMRKLTEEEMNAYRQPFVDPGSREPIYRWPNELPIGGEPASTHRLIQRTNEWLARTALPKLHLYGSPGAANPPEVAQWASKNMKNIDSVLVGQGLHYLQEDQPDAIGNAIQKWLKRIDRT